MNIDAASLERSPPLTPALALNGSALLRLMMLSSSLCPIGAFAHSQGLEHAVERGWITDEPSLTEWLCGLGLHNLAALDLPLLLLAHDAWNRADTARARRIAERVLANREARELWEQEQKLGGALANVLHNLGVPHAAALCTDPSSSYVVSYALGASHFEIAADVAAFGYAFAWSEQQVNAAARLVPLGHMASQRVLSKVVDGIPGWVDGARRCPDHEIGSSAPALAMGAAWHETQYCRLFRS
jgi:urease accessory protein